MRSFAVFSLLSSLALGAPVLQPREGKLIPGAYIVVLKNTASSDFTTAEASSVLSTVTKSHTFDAPGFKGFSANLTPAQLKALEAAPEVDFIEQDAEITINAYVTQAGAPWGLGRISHKSGGSTEYVYDDSAGEGTCSYIIDTGIYTAHSDFGGRATWLTNTIDSSNSDGNGHGTHVAGTVGGSRYGVAKKTTLYAVKVLNASGGGTVSSVVAGMNFVATDVPKRSCPKGVTANMSLGGGLSSAINAAAAALVRSGVFLAVAAGNSGANAANYSPASEATACTVGAVNSAGGKPSWSNYGPVVDIFAPGDAVLSAWIGGTSATNTISGTSMASPHIAGLGAYYLSLLGPKTPVALCDYIKSVATVGAISGLPSGTSNLLAFNGNPSG